MSYWMVDLRDRVAQRVTEDADTPEPNDRFFKVEADSVQEAIDKAEKARTVYNKLNDLDAIEAWVKSQPDGAIVGYVNHQCKCP
ncbi:MAG TPA: hypothetical protein V6C65_13385, partial [Allocoleopsis sp.]